MQEPCQDINLRYATGPSFNLLPRVLPTESHSWTGLVSRGKFRGPVKVFVKLFRATRHAVERAISFRVIDQLSRRLSRNNRALLSDESVSLTALPPCFDPFEYFLTNVSFLEKGSRGKCYYFAMISYSNR